MGTIQPIQVLIVGAERDGLAVYRVIMGMDKIQIAGVIDTNPLAQGIVRAKKDGIRTGHNLEDFLRSHKVDVILETSGNKEILQRIEGAKEPGALLIPVESARFIVSLIKERIKYLETLRLKGEMTAILNSMQEGIIVADNTGIISYVNPAFMRITGVDGQERIGKNIFEVSRTSPLTRCLITKEAQYGQRYRGSANVDVIGNTNPILVDGEMHGAVWTFQPLNDYVHLMEELKKSNTIIEGLYQKIGQITTKKFTFENLIGKTKIFRATVDMAKKASKSDSTVLILGESGVGKELFAHGIHNNSRRRDNPFITVNCAAIPEAMLESEFFGVERGIGGENKIRLGKLELAHGGTLFLDEIGDMNILLQAKLLRVLETKEFERIGGNETIKVDIRVIAASNRNLFEMVRRGEFREDLYYRINVVELPIPALRQRKEDIPLLIQHLVQKCNRKFGKKINGVHKETLEELLKHPWPGNVRELENAIERGMVAAEEEWLGSKELGPYLKAGGRQESYFSKGELMPLEKMEELLILEALNRFGYHLEGKKAAANALGISLATLYNKLKRINYREKTSSKY